MKKLAGNPYLKKENNKILIDLVPIDEFLKKSQTPIMVFLENRIRDNINTFKNVFSSVFKNFSCYYSFKANYLPEICNIVSSEGIGAAVVGLPELILALKIGFHPSKILVGGPYLPNELIERSIQNQVKEIIVYNVNDLNKINIVAKKYNHIQDICIRVNSQKYNSKLGIILNKENLSKLKNKINNCHHIKVNTILSHYTTQMNNSEQFKKNIKAIVENLKNLIKIGIDVKKINLGRGFPEATVMTQKQLKNIALDIKKTFEEFNTFYNSIYFEPGRYFVGDAGLFITEIIKVSSDRWVFLNIGNHICPRFAKCSLRFYNISQIDKAHKYKMSFLGILPTDQDVLVKDYFFTKNLNEGDKVMVTNVGAYTLTFSNRFPYALPKIFFVKDNSFKLVFNPSINHDFSIN